VRVVSICVLPCHSKKSIIIKDQRAPPRRARFSASSSHYVPSAPAVATTSTDTMLCPPRYPACRLRARTTPKCLAVGPYGSVLPIIVQDVATTGSDSGAVYDSDAVHRHYRPLSFSPRRLGQGSSGFVGAGSTRPPHAASGRRGVRMSW
jgi:hypothetical protein